MRIAMATSLSLDDIAGIDKLKFPLTLNGTRYEHKFNRLISQHTFNFRSGAATISLIWQTFTQPAFWVEVDGVGINYDRGMNLGFHSVEAIPDPKLRTLIALAFADLQGEERRVDPTKRHARDKARQASAEAAKRDHDAALSKALKKL
jgi:hypothetical protein